MSIVQEKKIANGRIAIYTTIPRRIVHTLDIRKGDIFVAEPDPANDSIIYTRIQRNIDVPQYPAPRKAGRPKKAVTTPQETQSETTPEFEQ